MNELSILHFASPESLSIGRGQAMDCVVADKEDGGRLEYCWRRGNFRIICSGFDTSFGLDFGDFSWRRREREGVRNTKRGAICCIRVIFEKYVWFFYLLRVLQMKVGECIYFFIFGNAVWIDQLLFWRVSLYKRLFVFLTAKWKNTKKNFLFFWVCVYNWNYNT